MAGLGRAGFSVVKRVTKERVKVRAINVRSKSRITCTFRVKTTLYDPIVLHSEYDSILCGSDCPWAQ